MLRLWGKWCCTGWNCGKAASLCPLPSSWRNYGSSGQPGNGWFQPLCGVRGFPSKHHWEPAHLDFTGWVKSRKRCTSWGLQTSSHLWMASTLFGSIVTPSGDKMYPRNSVENWLEVPLFQFCVETMLPKPLQVWMWCVCCSGFSKNRSMSPE